MVTYMPTALGGLSSGSLPTPPFPVQDIEIDIGILTYVHNVDGSVSFIDPPLTPLNHLPGSTEVSPPLSEVPLVSRLFPSFRI